MERQIALEELSRALELPLEAIDEDASFVGCGGHSITALQFASGCTKRGISVAVDSVLTSGTIRQILESCHEMEPPVSSAFESAISSPLMEASSSNPGGGWDTYQAQPGQTNGFSHDISDDGSLESNTSDRLSEAERFTPATSPETIPERSASSPVKATNDDPRPISVEVEEICSPNLERVGELTEIQLSLIHGSVQAPGTNIIHYYETYSTWNIPRMKEVWKRVLQQEPIFHTRYLNPEDECWLVPKFHWREFETTNSRRYKNVLAGDGKSLPAWPDATEAVDFNIRFSVLTLRDGSKGDDISTIIWSIHHALIDGWSAGQVLHKVRHAASTGILIGPGSSFVELAAALKAMRESRKAEGDEFWSSRKTGLAAARDKLMFSLPPESDQSGRLGELRVSFGRYWNSLEQTARTCRVSLPAILHAAWALTLARYTDSDNVVFGAVVSGRNLPLLGAFDSIGPLLNTLPFQINIAMGLSVREFLMDVFKHLQDLSCFAWTTPENGFSRSYESILAMQLEISEISDFGAVNPVRPAFTRQTTNTPVSIIVTGSGQAVLQFATDRYHLSHMRAVGRCFRDAIVTLTHLDMSLEMCLRGLMPTQSLATLRRFGNCESSWTTRLCSTSDLVTLFEASASSYPDNIAIQHCNRKITYAELDKLSGLLATKIAIVISPEEVVPVHADGSVNWIIATWAVLRAGGVYCPVHESHPQAVRDSILASCSAKYVLATSTEASEAISLSQATVINVADVLQAAGQSTETSIPFPHRSDPRPWEKAYVCFTSGSTGKPKGVICTHGGLVAFQRNLEVRLGARPGIRVAQFMCAAFDGSIHEIFSCLCYGATLILRDNQDPMGHLKLADSAILTPSIASHLDPGDFHSLKTVYLVGEAVSQIVCDKWASCKTLFNMYGPTEATCGATIARLLPRRPVTIGRPNPSTRVYILNHQRQLAPLGRIGEIWLAGVQVAHGYIGQRALTAERFHPDTICQGLGEYMYKTGDQGYWNEAGEIIFLGRTDRQIKVRGFRLDLDDLETRILGCCERFRAVAVTCETDRTELICMLQTDNRDVAQLREKISKVLPTYAVPRYITPVDKLPMTLAGKVDYKAVASDGKGNLPSNDRLETATETKLAAIWSTVLNLDPASTAIKPHSTFIELGGHSLHQLRLVSKLKTEFNIPVTLRTVTTLPTLRTLAQEIDSLCRITAPTVSACSDLLLPLGRNNPSTAETTWFYRYAHDTGGSAAFNVSFVARFDTKIDRHRLVESWNTVLARHEVFRSRYVKHRGVVQRVLAAYPPTVQEVKSIDVWLQLNTPFAVRKGPVVRVIVGQGVVVAMLSHVVCDYTTLALVLGEVAGVYNGGAGDPGQPGYWETTNWNVGAMACSVKFWKEYLDGVGPTQPAFLGNEVERTSYRGTSLVARVSPVLWRRMRAYIRDGRFTAQQVALAATALALSSRDDTMDVTVGIPFINRRSEADMRTVGLFLEPLPVRVAFRDPVGNQEGGSVFPALPMSCTEYVSAVQSLSQRALSHAMPWHQLLGHLGMEQERLLPDHPLFDCVVSFHDMTTSSELPDGGGAWSQLNIGPGIQPQFVWSEGSKFKLMVEFTAVNEDTLLLRLEYDDSCYEGEAHMAAVRRMILRALETVVTAVGGREECLFGALRGEMRKAWLLEEAVKFGNESSRDAEERLVARSGGLFQAVLANM